MDRTGTKPYSTEWTGPEPNPIPRNGPACMCEFYPGSANDDLNEEQMATALQASVAVLPLTKIVNLPDDGITTLPPAKPQGGEVYIYKPRCDFGCFCSCLIWEEAMTHA